MRTIFVTGSDTGIGKSKVAATIGRLLGRPSLRVQFVKPVESGRPSDEPGDADFALRESGLANAAAFTLLRYARPLAPLTASEMEGAVPLSLPALLEKWHALPPADLRVVEGAGGIAVPVDPDGSDWVTFAKAIAADAVVLVVPDRLGAINQGRLVVAYSTHNDLRAGLWLNEVQPEQADVRESNRDGLADLPLWATQRFQAPLPEDPDLAKQHLTTERS